MKGRVVFVLRIQDGKVDQFLQAYNAVRDDVAQGVKGHLVLPRRGMTTCRTPSASAVRSFSGRVEKSRLIMPEKDPVTPKEQDHDEVRLDAPPRVPSVVRRPPVRIRHRELRASGHPPDSIGVAPSAAPQSSTKGTAMTMKQHLTPFLATTQAPAPRPN
jgi:hypothetical protein